MASDQPKILLNNGNHSVRYGSNKIEYLEARRLLAGIARQLEFLGYLSGQYGAIPPG